MLGFHLASAPSHLRLAQLPLHRGQKPGRRALHHIVVRPGLHRRNGDVLTDASGNNDERDVERGCLQNPQCLRRIEIRHVVIRQDHVPCLRPQRVLHARRGLNPAPLDVVPAAPQGLHHDLRVELGILQHQSPQWNV